jgi:hypothetical protein
VVRVLIGSCSSSTHDCHISLFRSVAAGRSRAAATCFSTHCRSTVRSGGPCRRRARRNARRRSARSRHRRSRCRYAPRPGSRSCRSGVSTTTLAGPAPFSTATTRSRSDFPARTRQPTQVRRGDRGAALCSTTVYRLLAHAPTEPGGALTSSCDTALPGSNPALTGSGPPLSGWMSIRHPVNRAASRAFCPSLPIASES